MITKEHLLESIVTECRLIARLFTKLPEGSLDYRPTPDQRSTQELLSYLSFAIAGVAHSIVDGNWDWYNQEKERASGVGASGFPEQMDRQIKEIRRFIGALTEEDLRKQVEGMPWPNPQKVGLELLQNCLRWAIGYRMQLFLYAKASGASELNTFDCWFASEGQADWSDEGQNQKDS